MDPDSNVKEQIELAGMILDTLGQADELDGDDKDALIADAQRLAELVQALDGWIRGGGFIPSYWSRGNG